MITYKATTKLFRGKYQYKIVLVCPGAHHFRSGNMEQTLDLLNKVRIAKTTMRRSFIKTQDDLDYAHNIRNVIATCTDFDIRVESPWISFYTNNVGDITQLADVNPAKVKYICEPPKNITLEEGTIILPKVPFEFRVTIGKTNKPYLEFLEWAELSNKIRLTKSCKRELSRPRSWGGSFFYITGDKMLLLAKMHLSGVISRVDRIVKA